MKTKFVLISIFSIIILTACNKTEENVFPMQIDSVINVTDSSAIVCITDLRDVIDDSFFNPMVYLNTTGYANNENFEKLFSTEQYHQKNYTIYLDGLKSNTTYFVTATAIALSFSNEVSFKTK